MIGAVSLIPSPTLRRRRKEQHAKLWTAVCLCVGLLGGTITAGARALALSPGASTSADVAQAQAALDALVVRKNEMYADADAADKTRRAARRAANHPDWSILLAFVSDLCADRISLSLFSLEPADDGSGFDVRIEGIGQSQPDVAGFVLGLERSGVFRTTRLNGAGRANSEGVAFSATCLIRPNPELETATVPVEEGP